MKIIFSLCCFVFILNVPALAAGEQQAAAAVEKLSPEIRELLNAEMSALDAAMKNIITANAQGNYQQVAAKAREMKDSFILKQRLSSHQKHELHSSLPVGFIEKDQQFHYFAAMLEHAAKNHKPELVAFYFSRLFESCSDCHKSYASHRFSNFSTAIEQSDHQH